MQNLTPDFAEAQRFLELLAPDGNAVFQTFDDDDARKDEKLAWTTRDFSALEKMNARRAGVFVTVNEIAPKARRRAEFVTRVRALFADFDGTAPPEAWEIEPTVTVRTSPGKVHAYWFIKDGEEFPREEFPDAQRAIAHHFKSDRTINDLCRVMRLPGFWHQKGEPAQVKILTLSAERYSVEMLREWVSRIAPPPPEVPEAREHVPLSSLNGSTPPYVKAAVERALGNLASQTAQSHNRNNTLNSEAFGLFGLVKGGWIPESIRGDLERIALGIGLQASEVKATLDSAWRGAKARTIPKPRSGRDWSFSEQPEQPPHDPETGELIEGQQTTEAPAKPKKEKAIKPVFDEAPFRMLGHNKGTYFYLPRGSGQVVGLRAQEHTSLRLLGIAPLNYWYSARKNAEEGKITEYQWQQFANGLMQAQHDEGIFNEKRMRGRGAWMDGKRVVVHTGSEAIVDGQPMALTQVNSPFIYESAEPWEFGFGDAASTAEAQKLVDICTSLTWDDELSGRLLAGWCVIAPVSGALPWRPHIWISGQSGSGKSTALKDIVGRIVEPAGVRFDGKTTEPAIRQTIGIDALPVILDEAEGEDAAAAARMQEILDYMRVAASGGKIAKGGQGGKSVFYIARSCFCLSSIHSSLKNAADESRVTRLILRKNEAPDADAHYRLLMQEIERHFTPEFASRMFARTVKNLPTMLANIDVFGRAASIVLKSRRAADQLGPFLAGLYLCHSDKTVNLTTAEQFIRKHSWTEHLALDSDADHVRLFAYIMSRKVRCLTNEGTQDLSVGQAIEQHRSELGPIGIAEDRDFIWIANKSPRLAELLREKPQWAADWKQALLLLPEAERGEVRYFAPGLTSRAVVLPRSILRGV